LNLLFGIYLGFGAWDLEFLFQGVLKMGFMVDADVVLFNGNIITVDGKKPRPRV